MGRQAYLNRLALGRSPYEPPEASSVDPLGPVRRVSNIHADNYMQQYDSRGHPVNPESKTLGRELRRAKNDILSTMGIVVSGEDRNAKSSNEQETMTQIAAENDFGLVITTLDQLFVFFGTWWSSSLTGRIHTYQRYTHAAVLDTLHSERCAVGVINFYTAGIPAWAVSSTLAIARDNPLKRVFVTLRDYFLGFTSNENSSLGIRSLSGLAYSITRNCVLLLSVEAYMYSLLQSLSLVPSNVFPSTRLLIPFRGGSLIQLPPLPTDLSAPSIGAFLMRLMTSPGALTFLYAFYLRPELEERIYRLIRRQLPKPTLADELSIRVAYEENLIEWLVPSLGRKSEEETRRARLTLLQDIKHEIIAIGRWVFTGFGLLPKRSPELQAIEGVDPERIESLRNTIETLRHELQEAHTRAETESSVVELPNAAATATPRDVPATSDDAEVRDAEPPLDMNQVLTNENRMSQSPGEMSNDYFQEIATLGQRNTHSAMSHPQSQASHQQGYSAQEQQNSRSNTLVSRPSSPETSPPTSPRVRASLIHQSSDIITMQLELLGNRNRNPENPTSVPSPQIPRLGRDSPGFRPHSHAVDRNRSIAEFLEALILTQAHLQATQRALQTDDDLSNSAGEDQSAETPEPELRNLLQVGANLPQVPEEPEEPSTSQLPNILPDGVEEPNDDEPTIQPQPAADAAQNADSQGEPEVLPPTHPSRVQGQPLTDSSATAHRVTLLSAHPVDSLASHLAAVISTIILSPLESLCLRSLATSYLTMYPSSDVMLSDLHPMGLWFGGQSWSDRFAYTGRLVLLRGMQAALRAGVWGFLVGSTMRIGRKFCGWGSL
ncbi:hypothetical protein N7492_005070 [Penicillium capsulatum]|uniref:Uncharacterized protein n=1 Tax=Penicillium capsulatum TaxID=69766 RepID=A0A9W9ICR4_9EURO|nr:hypothetical protein N7492_005070 [Penicillium capsulatum]KAJ6135822.1 hypothetical protein N7512_000982 [Penicillium capsulatum]